MSRTRMTNFMEKKDIFKLFASQFPPWQNEIFWRSCTSQELTFANLSCLTTVKYAEMLLQKMPRYGFCKLILRCLQLQGRWMGTEDFGWQAICRVWGRRTSLRSNLILYLKIYTCWGFQLDVGSTQQHELFNLKVCMMIFKNFFTHYFR